MRYCKQTIKGYNIFPIEFGLGLNIRFKVPAIAFLITKDLPNPEDARQIMARGSQGMVTCKGFIFTVGDPMASNSLTKQCLRHQGPDYYEAALILRTLRTFAQLPGVKTSFKKLETAMEKGWMITVD